MKLEEIVDAYGTPPPEVVKQRDNGSGFTGDYVGHGHVTKMLIAIDPMWDWQPAAWIDGKPAITITESVQTFRSGETKKTRIATMWGFMTVLGKTLPCVGSAKADKEDVEKELIGDLIRNGALRFGVCINLWARTDDHAPRQATPARTYETRQDTAPRNIVSSNGALKIKGDQHGDLPDWLASAAAEQGIIEVYDNRNTATAQNKRPWFKCTSSGTGLWPPRGANASVVNTPSDEEPF